MKLNDKRYFEWFYKLGKAWEQKKPDAVLELLDDEFKYYETPFSKPYTKKEEILKLWEDVPKSQKDITFSFDIISLDINTAIAHWNASFTRIKNNERAILDGIFLIKLNNKDLCTLFKQWWNTKE
jgi:hypothetical protein